MKVPYLNKKRAKEMAALVEEFNIKITENLERSSVNERLKEPWMCAIYPLLALLGLLTDGEGALNPSREYALLGAKSAGDRDTFLEAINSFQASKKVTSAMQRAHKETIFTGFIAELRSDLLLVLVQGLIFSYRGSAVGLRCALEDLYRHLYYMDHPQEFLALSSGHQENSMDISPKSFRDYLKITSYLSPLHKVCFDFSKKPEKSPGMDWFGKNEELYGKLSAAVHGASNDWFAAVSSASSLSENIQKNSKLNAVFVDFAKLCVTALIAAHRDIFSSANDYDKSLILDIFEPNERAGFRFLFNV